MKEENNIEDEIIERDGLSAFTRSAGIQDEPQPEYLSETAGIDESVDYEFTDLEKSASINEEPDYEINQDDE